MSDFSALCPQDGYLPIEDHGLIGDGTTAALVARDSSISWLCLPRFNSAPLFARLLDRHRGGAFSVAPETVRAARQYYELDSGVLVTELRGETGLVRLTDALTLRVGSDLSEDVPADRHELVRCLDVLEGPVRVRVAVEPFEGGSLERYGGGYALSVPSRPDLHLHLCASQPLTGLCTTLDLDQGDRLHLSLRWGRPVRRHSPLGPDEAMDATRHAWRRWMQRFHYEGPQRALVRRSAITLKMLDYLDNGALVAAPTTSLPEVIGGVRNWDYRFSWVRDAAYTVYALNRVGMRQEALGFLGWTLDAAERHGRPHVVYTLDGTVPKEEREDYSLEGYRGSRPVRWGNAASGQVQHDLYGEIIDCAYIWSKEAQAIDPDLWQRIRPLIETAADVWRTPDQGIWEVRSSGRVFTYSAALCHVALDRGARLAERYGLPGDSARWRACAEEIREAILTEAWDDEIGSLTETLGPDGALDASLLTLPLRRLLTADHPKMAATTAAIARELSAGDGLLYRYLPKESPDGLPGHEGAFLLCSFWLVDNLTLQGRVQEALDLFDGLCARAGTLGLLPEEIDPTSGAFLGNYPQAFSHVGLISSGVNLAAAIARQTEATAARR
jgi:GH15 family glucan-1,4-alpha-glucosidase